MVGMMWTDMIHDQWCNTCYLLGVWTNPIENIICLSNWIIFAGRGVNTKKTLKPSPSYIQLLESLSTRWFWVHLTAELMARTNRKNLQLQGGTPWRCLSPCILGGTTRGHNKWQKVREFFGAKPLPSLISLSNCLETFLVIIQEKCKSVCKTRHWKWFKLLLQIRNYTFNCLYLYLYLYIWVFPKIGAPQNGWFKREKPC